MADKHLYDEHGNYKGRISDSPPRSPAGSPGAITMIMAICAIVFCWFPVVNLFFLFWSVGFLFCGDVSWIPGSRSSLYETATTLLTYAAVAVNILFWGAIFQSCNSH